MPLQSSEKLPDEKELMKPESVIFGSAWAVASPAINGTNFCVISFNDPQLGWRRYALDDQSVANLKEALASLGKPGTLQ